MRTVAQSMCLPCESSVDHYCMGCSKNDPCVGKKQRYETEEKEKYAVFCERHYMQHLNE
jgi:hypothetical protein